MIFFKEFTYIILINHFFHSYKDRFKLTYNTYRNYFIFEEDEISGHLLSVNTGHTVT